MNILAYRTRFPIAIGQDAGRQVEVFQIVEEGFGHAVLDGIIARAEEDPRAAHAAEQSPRMLDELGQHGRRDEQRRKDGP